MSRRFDPDAPLDERTDAAFMAAAIAYGRRGLGLTAPNPAVGCLIVRDGVIVGRGATQQGGRPHAETEAIRDAGEKARGATLYVSLEPCSHHGVTPPCAEAIVAAGLARVVSAIEDPDRRVAGRGHAKIVEAGIGLLVGVGAREARRLTLGHILRVTEGRPMTTLKLAETADGYAAGDALVVTGGAFDVDPSYYGGGPAHATVITKDRRTAFEFGDAMQHQPPGRGFGPFSIDPGRIDDRRQGVRTDAAEETRITRQRRTVPAERQRSGRHGYCF